MPEPCHGRQSLPQHTCRARGCSVQIKRRLLMCRHHWDLVPPEIQTAVTTAWRHGSARLHLEAVSAAIRAVADAESADRKEIVHA